MTLDFDPFWMFKMIGDPLLLIGDPKKISLVTPEGDHQGVTKKKHVSNPQRKYFFATFKV